MQFIQVKYQFNNNVDCAKQADVIAIGQTAGTWNEKWKHKEGILKEYLGQVVDISKDDSGSKVATIAFPLHNFENNIASLLTIIFGKYSLAGIAKVIEIKTPDSFGISAKFGTKGIRKITGVDGRPFIMAIFKPALGLSADDHAAILREAAFAGLDIIKDEEVLGDIESCKTLDRLKKCRKVIEEVKKHSGKEVLYAVNVTGKAHQVIERARNLVAEGANALLFNVFTHGFSLLESLVEDDKINVPIFAHPAFAGAIGGMSYPVLLGKLMELSGVDAVLYPSHRGNIPFSKQDESEIRNILQLKGILPVPSAGITPSVVEDIVADYGVDVALNAGTAIMDNKNGIGEGVREFYSKINISETG